MPLYFVYALRGITILRRHRSFGNLDHRSLTVHGHEQIVERLGQRRVSVSGVA